MELDRRDGEEALRGWIEHYVAAWNSNDPVEIGALFGADAIYLTEPWAEPWRGRDEIVRGWLEKRDEPGDTAFEWDVVGHEAGLWIVQGDTYYRSLDRWYHNLWLIRLDADGRAAEFREWWMQRPSNPQ